MSVYNQLEMIDQTSEFIESILFLVSFSIIPWIIKPLVVVNRLGFQLQPSQWYTQTYFLTILAVKRIQQYWYISCFETVAFHYDLNSTAENLSVGIRSRKQCFSCGLVANRNWDCDCQDCRAKLVNFWILSTLWLQNKLNNFITDWSGRPISSKDLWVSRI